MNLNKVLDRKEINELKGILNNWRQKRNNLDYQEYNEIKRIVEQYGKEIIRDYGVFDPKSDLIRIDKNWINEYLLDYGKFGLLINFKNNRFSFHT